MNESLRAFFSFLAPDQVLDSPEDLAFYGRDSCKDFIANPGLILHPKNSREVQQILKVAHDSRIAIVPSGGRTGYNGDATATNGEVVLSLARLNKVLEVNHTDMTLRWEAGVPT